MLRLTRYHGIGLREAYMLLGQAGRLRVGNMIDPFYSVLASIDRCYFSEAEYAGSKLTSSDLGTNSTWSPSDHAATRAATAASTS